MYGPSLPATGGAATIALFWGIQNQNMLLIAFAVVIVTIVLISFFKLRHGEKNM